MQSLMCPKCKIKEELFNMANREECTVMIYNEHNPRVRKEDGLHIFPMICFKCKTMTEFASDPTNESGKAIDGVEYFKTKKITQKDVYEARIYASENNYDILENKLSKFD